MQGQHLSDQKIGEKGQTQRQKEVFWGSREPYFSRDQKNALIYEGR